MALAGSMPPLTSEFESHLPLATDAMEFVDRAPGRFHAMKLGSDALENSGFVDGTTTRAHPTTEH